jgi:uroporphyrinogen-III synthase
MDHLAGWTVAITADRRAPEQAELLQRRGADVVLAPLVHARPMAEGAIRGATDELLRAPIDLVIATSAVGLRTWLAMAWTWDLGDRVLATLRGTTVIARGSKVAGVLVGEDLTVDWDRSADTLAEILELQARASLAGKRVAVLLPGNETTWFLDRLRDLGAEVVGVPVYEVSPTTARVPRDRLLDAAQRNGLDAITYTSPAAVHALAEEPGLVDQLNKLNVAHACVGPITANAAHRVGLANIVTAGPHRLGSMVRSLGEHLVDRGHTLEIAGVTLRHQGARIEIDGVEATLTPRERRLLDAMLATAGAVLSKERLTSLAWDERVDEHTVEVAVNRLRRKLGPAAVALETTNRRGYRIAV